MISLGPAIGTRSRYPEGVAGLLERYEQMNGLLEVEAHLVGWLPEGHEVLDVDETRRVGLLQ